MLPDQRAALRALAFLVHSLVLSAYDQNCAANSSLISVSIVSHRQASLAAQVVADLARVTIPLEIIITINAPEAHDFAQVSKTPRIKLLANSRPKGFAANHNAAFSISSAPYFCVMNPDVRLNADPFPPLLHCLQDQTLGVVAPRVESPDGLLEDSGRAFPTPMSILGKALGVREPAATAPTGVSYPDWVAGMFMLFPRQVYERAGGFDESYFLYYEDADLCARLRKLGYRIGYCADVSVVHAARRTSHRNLRYAGWHLSSMTRFFWRRATGKM
jgi:hypothetical protein